MKRALAAVATALVACSSTPRSEAELKAELTTFVADKRACAVDADCVLASTGCPLGCGTAVAAAHRAAVEAKARELIAEYQSDGQRCDYDCVPVDARCVSSLCTAVQK